jgi:hypothetical protein
MKIEFFEYKENCEEFRILKKAASEFATRTDLKKGQILFKSINKNIVVMETKLNEIRDVTIKRKLEHFETYGKKSLNLGKVVIEYEAKTERDFLRCVQTQFEHYCGFIVPKIEQILEFLDSDFDYEMHKKHILKIEKEIKEGKIDVYTQLKFQEIKRPIEQAIKIVLEYYSKISLKLENYYELVLMNS